METTGRKYYRIYFYFLPGRPPGKSTPPTSCSADIWAPLGVRGTAFGILGSGFRNFTGLGFIGFRVEGFRGFWGSEVLVFRV